MFKKRTLGSQPSPTTSNVGYQFDMLSRRLEVTEGRILAMCELLEIAFAPTKFHFEAPDAYFKRVPPAQDIIRKG